MTSLLVGILAALAALAVLLPLTSARRGQGFAVAAPGDDRRRELLRELADSLDASQTTDADESVIGRLRRLWRKG